MKNHSSFFKWLAGLGMGVAALFGVANAQTGPIVYGCSPFQDSMWAIDTTTWGVVQRTAPSLAGFTITGITGMAYDPCQHETYVIMKVSGVSGRVLGKMDLGTGVCTQVGNLGDNFSTISFREDGQLFGVTGNGAAVPETMYLIDKTNGTKTLAAALGAGADGEVIAYNQDDNLFYHWSGNGTVVYESVLSTSPYSATNIPIVGTPSGETFGALYLGNNKFLISNISSSFNYCYASGEWTGSFGSNPDDLRGLVMPVNFEFGGTTSGCPGFSSTWTFGGYSPDSIRYIWGDGGVDMVGPKGNGAHTYTTPGTYTAYAVLVNACNPADTMASQNITVFPLPVVVLGSSTNPAYICSPGDSVQIIANAPSGTYQWYANGAILPGASGSSVYANTPGIYNMIAIDGNGCSDSAATGYSVDYAPTVSLLIGPDTLCAGDSTLFAATPGANSYEWLQNGVSVATTSGSDFWVSNAGTWSVVATFGNCPDSSATVDITVFAPPAAGFSQSADTVRLDTNGVVNFTNTSTNGTSVSWTFGDGNSSTQSNPSHTYVTPGTYTVTQTVTNLCGSDNFSSTVVVLDTLVGRNQGLGGMTFLSKPNPFRSVTTFDLMNPSSQNVELMVYNASGQLVAVLFEGRMAAGSQSLRWDATNLPAGMYQAVLRTQECQLTRRVVLLP